MNSTLLHCLFEFRTTHIKYANMKNSLSFVCLKNINNYKIEY